jgi:hypothetical protein
MKHSAIERFGALPVAVFFEASGIVRDALISVGVNAVSIDLRETERPGPHIIANVFDWLDAGWGGGGRSCTRPAPTCVDPGSTGMRAFQGATS